MKRPFTLSAVSAPSEKYEAQRAQLQQELEELAPEPLRSRLNSLLRPAIMLTTSPSTGELPQLASKFGGNPDVPVGFEWPMCEGDYLSFIAQLNLEELAPFDLENKLPKSGLLSFWANEMLAIDLMDEPQAFGAWRVFHFQDSTWQQLSPPEINRSGFEVFPPTSLQFHAAASLANVWGNAEFYGEEFEKEIASALYDLCPVGRHQMFGYPDSIQDDVRYEISGAWNEREGSEETVWQDWELLLQVSGDENAEMGWGDSGAIYFLVRRSDLIKGDFSKCWFVFQCC